MTILVSSGEACKAFWDGYPHYPMQLHGKLPKPETVEGLLLKVPIPISFSAYHRWSPVINVEPMAGREIWVLHKIQVIEFGKPLLFWALNPMEVLQQVEWARYKDWLAQR